MKKCVFLLFGSFTNNKTDKANKNTKTVNWCKHKVKARVRTILIRASMVKIEVCQNNYFDTLIDSWDHREQKTIRTENSIPTARWRKTRQKSKFSLFPK